MDTFSLGQVVFTRNLWTNLLSHYGDNAGILRATADLLERHRTGDWGNLDAEDTAANDAAVKHGGRLFSSYKVGEEVVWIITEGDRSLTTLLLPEDY